VITDVAGVRVGHWTNDAAQTGCTVVLLPPGAVASGEVRGGAPGTREFEMLVPGRTVRTVNAVVLTGGSAFGLAACDGVMRWCEERGYGVETRVGVVPIVVGAVIFDLAVGDASVRPDAAAGYAACDAATEGAFECGRVGAGTGATYAKQAGFELARPGGIGTATFRDGDVIVSALVVVNAVGDIRGHGHPLERETQGQDGPTVENTTIGVIATNAALGKTSCHLVAQAGHAGMARAIEPVHTRRDGDALVAASCGQVASDVEVVSGLAALAVENAIYHAVL
jgi:L-aminopeptidase/D-esterase-like protein